MPNDEKPAKKMRKTAEEKIREIESKEEELRKKKAQLEARKKQLEYQLKERQRKERTHRLITIGAIFEHHWGFLSQERAEKLAWSLRESAKEIIDNDK